jgi:V-type H+-transporting ATPase subunit H
MGGQNYRLSSITPRLSYTQGYQRAGRVTSEELALIKKVDRQPKSKTEPLLLSDGQTYALLYLRLLKKLTRDDTVSCVLVLVGDALAGVSDM